MHHRFWALLICMCWSWLITAQETPFALVIHGGAGTILKKNMTDEREQAFRQDLEKALDIGYQILDGGGTAIEAVEATIRFMEDSPLFNAGKGSVFTSEGTNELDASIMDGSNLQAGAVSGVKRVKNPITLARLVMTDSKHVMLSGEGAEAFGAEKDVKMVDPKYFYTESRWKSLERAKKREQKDDKHGTVGVAALDKAGNLAAGTSTGGMTNKRWGRIGDSPIIGAGTYADNRTCAISATGSGEYFIRLGVTRDISALMEYRKLSLQEAADEVIQKKLTKLGGTGGVVALDHKGEVAWSFNTEGMYRGYRKAGQGPVTGIYKDDP